MVLDVDGEADHGEPQEEVIAPKESDVSSRAASDNTVAVPPLSLSSASAETPTPPLGKNFPTPEGPPQWIGPLVYEASVSAFNTSFRDVAVPMIELAVQRAIKKHYGSVRGGGAWANDYNKKTMGGARNSPELSSQSSSWRAPSQCERCYGKFNEFQSKVWKDSWDLILETPAELRDGPWSWSQSMNTYLYDATAKAVADGKPKREMPNYDAATISLATSKMEKVLYDPEQW